MLPLLSLSAQVISFDLPQYMTPLYDSYSQNYMNTVANGRGNTGAADNGGIGQILINPAGFTIDQGSLDIEMSIKPPTKELDRALGKRYSSPVPFGLIGISQKLSDKLMGAIVYSMPKSVTYDDYSIVMNQGVYLLQRFPTYNLHQFTAALAYHIQDFSVGLNLHNQIHYLDDITYFRTFDRVSEIKYSFRPQLGVNYNASRLSVGATFMPEQALEIDSPYKYYDSVQPMKVTGGIKLNVGERNFLIDADYEQFSAINSAYADRLILKAGYELLSGDSVYRLGFLSVPEVYHGAYVMDANTTTTADTSLVWLNVPNSGVIRSHDQRFVTIGYSKKFKVGSVNLSFMQDVVGYAPVSQINLAVDLYLSTFKAKDIIKP
jgi:hypothetical protein